MSSLIPKIYKCDLRWIIISAKNFTIKEYQFLTSSGVCKTVALYFCDIKNDDGTSVAFEKLFENIQKIEDFSVECSDNSFSMFKPHTFNNLADVTSNTSLERFSLSYLREDFDISTTLDFLLKNDNKYVFLDYCLHSPISDAYKEILETCIAKIIATPPKRIPHIYFPGFSGSTLYIDYKKLYDACYNFLRPLP
uniref:Uncharacterized protein n=1 Tax=Panagrolaimus sp. ES5 TaxID=591445 RepID=A0AC34F2P3_9BILA